MKLAKRLYPGGKISCVYIVLMSLARDLQVDAHYQHALRFSVAALAHCMAAQYVYV